MGSVTFPVVNMKGRLSVKANDLIGCCPLCKPHLMVCLKPGSCRGEFERGMRWLAPTTKCKALKLLTVSRDSNAVNSRSHSAIHH